MEIEHLDVFSAFLKQNLKTSDYDEDAYLEKLIIHWGETGETTYLLPAEETVSGQPEVIQFSTKTKYFIRENGEEIEVEDLDEGYDVYRPILVFDPDALPAPLPEEQPVPPHSAINPMEVLMYKCGKSLKDVAAVTSIPTETLEAYMTAGYDMASIPLGQADAIAKVLNVHAEALLSCAPAAPRRR